MQNTTVAEDATILHAMSGAFSDMRQLPAQTQLAPTTTAEPPTEHLSIIETAQETRPVYPTGTKF